MKKNIEILKDENAILTSYKLDLEQKKRMLQNELKVIKKQKTKNLSVDETKAKDLILEKIHKPDISIVLEKEKIFPNKSTPLAEKERIITRFKRYDPLIIDECFVNEQPKKNNDIGLNTISDIIKDDFDLEINKQKEEINVVDDSNEIINDISIILTPSSSDEEVENSVIEEKTVILPYIKKINEQPPLPPISETINNQSENIVDQNAQNQNNKEIDDQEAIYPVPYKKLQKYKWWAKDHNKEEYNFNDTQQNDEIEKEEYHNDNIDIEPVKLNVFNDTTTNFNDIVEWVKLNNKKSIKKREKEAKKKKKV